MPSDFLQQLRATFMAEAQEHLQTMSHGFLRWEKVAEPAELQVMLRPVFRAAHSLKGAARAVEMADMEAICQSLEDVFAGWGERPVVPTAEAMDLLHRSLDLMTVMLDTLAAGGTMPTPPELPALRKALRRFSKAGPASISPAAQMLATQGMQATSLPRSMAMPIAPATASLRLGPVQAPPPFSPLWPEPSREPAVQESPTPERAQPLAPAPQAAAEHLPPEADRTGAPAPLQNVNTLRIALPKLLSQLLGAEEMLAAKLSAGQRVAEVRVFADWLADWRKAWSAMETDARRLRHTTDLAPDLQRMLDFFDWSGDAVHAMEGRVADIGRAVRHDRDAVGKLVNDLLDSTKQLLLLPFATISASFPKLVRDLCRYQEKQADLVITGEQIEIDKLILEEMKDPLVHMLRNAVDHAVELPALRAQLGKPPRATITLEVSQLEGNKVQLLLSDDGAGIAPDKVRAAAVRLGVVTPEEAEQYDNAALQALVFRSELSTSTTVTRLSGRGLGLAIVQERARKLGGDATVQSQAGVGTTFRIVLPAGRATFRGILCEAGGQQFLISTTAVDRVTRVRRDAVRSVEGRETLAVGARLLGVVRLADALELATAPAAEAPSDMLQLLLVGTSEQGIAFVVDAVLDEQEVLVKPLRRPLCRVRNVAAAAVLGSGKVVPILNVADLVRSARRVAGRTAGAVATVAARGAPARSILLAEDSITSRMLLKSILVSAGYVVRTAVDGLDAYSMLRTESFDLLVSDVEMPRLNGFDLAARVRADKKLRDLPIILVTALATRADRERGVDAGANAYIVKGSFDQNNLISTVRQLL